jgi:hypothetical protein
MTQKYTKWPHNKANGHKVFILIVIKLIKNYHSKAFQNLPWGRGYENTGTIWQP